jgi:hypothetical protein
VLAAKLKCAKEAADTSQVDYWTKEVTSRAVKIDSVPNGPKIAVLDMPLSLVEKVWRNIRRDPLHRSCCYVRGTDLVCFVLGLDTPPEGLSDWVVVNVEGKNLAECL